MADFSVTTRESEPVIIVDIKGYLDAHTAPSLENVFNNFIENNKFQIVVNFKDLIYISSAGLGVFMAYVETMREHKGDIKFADMKKNVFDIFDLLGFPLLYEFFDDENEAIKKFIG